MHCKVGGPSGALAGTRNAKSWVRISGQRYNRHTLTHEIGHALGLNHWNLNDCSMGYPRTQTQWLSEWDLMAISAIWQSEPKLGQTRDSMREALGIPKDAQWAKYSDNPDLLTDNPESPWVELANLLKAETLAAINRTEPKY